MATCFGADRSDLCGGRVMIFVTVGTQLAFPRLIKAMDRFAEELYEPVVAQTAEHCRCNNLIVEPYMSGERYAKVIAEARLVIAHAGIGTVLAARDAGIPLVLVPRRAELGEHRNDHQSATVRELKGRKGITAVWDTSDLRDLLRKDLTAPMGGAAPALDGLVSELRSFIG